MKKSLRPLLAALIALMLGVAPLSAMAEVSDEIDYSSLYFFPADELNVSLYIASDWESLAVETGNVFPVSGAEYAQDGSLLSGYALFFYLSDPAATNAAENYEAARDIALQTGIGLAGIVRYPAGGKPEDAGLTGYSYREIGKFDGYALAAAWVDPSVYANADPQTIPLLDAVVASLRDTDDYVLMNLSGDTLGLFHTADIYGEEKTHLLFGEVKFTLLNAWATYCGPCISEMPDLGALAEEYAAKGVQIVGVPIDIFASDGTVSESQLTLAKQIVEKTGANYTHLIANEEMFAGLLSQVEYVPSSWFIDSEGNVIGEIIIGGKSKSEWAAAIDGILATLE